MNPETTKTCTKCGNTLPITSFTLRRKNQSTRHSDCKQCRNALKRASYDPVAQQASYLKCVYGITVEDYDRMFTEQSGGCAICGGTNADGRKLSVDHNHTTDAVRGLLCHSCNVLLGFAYESSDTLRLAAQYLDAYKEPLCGVL